MNPAQKAKRESLVLDLQKAKFDGRDTQRIEAQIDRIDHEATMQSASRHPREVVDIETVEGWSFLKIFKK